MWSKLGPDARRISLAILAAGAIIFAVQIFEIFWYYGVQGVKLKAETQPFSLEREVAEGKILIVGDSTGAGTGASKPEETIAGFLAEDGFFVKNKAKWGAMTEEIAEQLRNEEKNKYDLILIFTGGNDILWFSDLDRTVLNLEDILKKAKEIGKKVIVIPPGNVGLAPMFKEPVGLLYTRRTRFVRAEFMKKAEENGAIYVDLFTENLEEIFSGEPFKYFGMRD
jgi:lysophospholipase L1-like esterase